LLKEQQLMKYHHLGIPTTVKHKGETYLPQFKMYVSGYETSPYRIQWMRFEQNSPLPELVKTIPHVAFEVDDLQQALIGKQVLIEPNSPSIGVMVAFIIDDGAPVELLQIQSHQTMGMEIAPVHEN
jgi:hypothetical protein